MDHRPNDPLPPPATDRSARGAASAAFPASPAAPASSLRRRWLGAAAAGCVPMGGMVFAARPARAADGTSARPAEGGAATGAGAAPARAAAGSLGTLASTAQTLAYDGWLESDGQPATRIARATWRWEPEGGAYRLAMEIDSPLIRLVFESSGRLEADGLRPQRYRESRKLPMRGARERLVRFDGTAEPAAGGEGGDRLTLPPGGQDRLSVVMQLALLARARPTRFAPGNELVLPLASWRSVDDARFAVGRHETVELGGRGIEAQRIRRIAAEADQAGIELWLADDALRTPAVIRFDDDGRGLRFTLA